MAPFAKGEDITRYKPFWLYELQETGFVRASEIKAYTPYVVSMPNNPDYADDYILAGNVTYSATNVYVEQDESNIAIKGSVKFAPSMQHRESSTDVLAINLEDYTDADGTFYPSGSAFLPAMRAVRPFEAFALINNAAMAKPMTIGEMLWNEATDIRNVEMKGLSEIGKKRGVYDMLGRHISKDSTIFRKKSQHREVFIVNGKKMVVK